MSDLPSGVTLQELRVFFALAEDPHFGRAAAQLYLSQPYVSRTLASLERKVGGRLVDRTAHRLTPLGNEVLADIRPAYDDLRASLDRARARADCNNRALRVGCTYAVHDTTIAGLRAAYQEQLPGGVLDVIEALPSSPYSAVRAREFDVFLWWCDVRLPDFDYGPPIETQQGTGGMRADHPLRERDELTLDDVADYGVMLPEYFHLSTPVGTMFPATTPEGREIRREYRNPGYLANAAYGLADSDLIYFLSDGVVRVFAHRKDLTFRPIAGLPPYRIAPMWLRGRADARIRALAVAAASLGVGET